MRRIRPDLPLFFPLFFHVRRSGVSRMPLFFFPCFFHVRRSGVRRTRPGSPLFFPFFSTSGGVLGAASGPICPRFFPFFPRQMEWDGAGSSAGWAVPQETAR